jgi:hypothetical protein
MFDSLAAAIDWLDAYRGKSQDVVDFYQPDARLECGCKPVQRVRGTSALEAYWNNRFRTKPALELVDLQPTGAHAVRISYKTSGEVVSALLQFDPSSGKIEWQRCGPE